MQKVCYPKHYTNALQPAINRGPLPLKSTFWLTIVSCILSPCFCINPIGAKKFTTQTAGSDPSINLESVFVDRVDKVC